jgi:hypothetical protein
MAAGQLTPYSPECVEGLFSEVRIHESHNLVLNREKSNSKSLLRAGLRHYTWTTCITIHSPRMQRLLGGRHSWFVSWRASRGQDTTANCKFLSDPSTARKAKAGVAPACVGPPEGGSDTSLSASARDKATLAL